MVIETEQPYAVNHLSLIVAVSRNGVIGANGTIPWRLPEDLKFFKRTTLGHAVIMGRKTYESIGKPLPGRRNIIVSRSLNWSGTIVGPCEIVNSLGLAITIARETDEAPFVIGGAAIYAEALPLVDRIFMTEVHRDVEGDVLFPELDASEWNEVSRKDTTECSWVVLERKS
jgi:dihydrofolate reductase